MVRWYHSASKPSPPKHATNYRPFLWRDQASVHSTKRARAFPYVYCYFLPFSSSSIYYCFHFTLISTTYLQQCRSNRSEQPVPSFNCCGCGYTSKTDGVCSYYSHSVISVYASSFECKIFSRLWNWRRRFCLVETGNSCRYLYSLKVVRESTWEQ